MKKTIKRVLIVLGILLAAVLIYFGAQFLRLRAAMSRMTPEPIPAGEAVDEAIAATQAGQVRGYITDGIFSTGASPTLRRRSALSPPRLSRLGRASETPQSTAQPRPRAPFWAAAPAETTPATTTARI